MVRLLFASLLFLTSLLTIFRAPTFHLWELSIGIIEWGHFLVFLPLLLFLPGWKKNSQARIAIILGIFSGILFITPTLRAFIRAENLPQELSLAFGLDNPASIKNKNPINALTLFKGVPIATAFIEGLTYSTRNQTQLTLDYYKPLGVSAPTPCVVVIHGGSWRSGDNSELSDLNRYLAGRGIAVAAINYSLGSQYPFPQALNDVKEALVYLKSHARELNLDANHLVLLGRSAGAELALLAAYTFSDPSIKGVISFYGPADLVLSYNNPGNPLVIDTYPILNSYLGKGSPNEIPSVYLNASPINFVTQKTVPTLLIHGEKDELVWFKQSERLAEALTKNHAPHYLLNLPWATHGCDYNFSGPCGQLSTYAVDYFLDEFL